MDVAGDVIQIVLDREVPRIKPVHFRFGKILEVCFSSLWGEEDIILSPENDGFGLPLAEKCLPHWVRSKSDSQLSGLISSGSLAPWR